MAFQIGEMRATAVVTSRFRLDGGSMFGVVPKALWEKKAPADEANRIELAVNTLVVGTAGKIILVEPGMGAKYDEKMRAIYALEECDMDLALARAGTTRDEVGIVVPTHLHFDHAGGSTLATGDSAAPSFPGTWFIVQEAEWNAATEPGPLERGSYNPSDFIPIADAGKMDLVCGTAEIAAGVRLELTGGHTRGHQVVRMRSAGDEALYLGDLVPTAAHLKLNWLAAWDLDPVLAYAQKERLLDDAARRGVTCFFAHDPRVAGARVRRAGGETFEIIEESVIEPS